MDAGLLSGLTKTDLAVLRQICADARADRFWRGFTALADAAGVDRRQIEPALEALERRNIIRRHKNSTRMTHVEVVPLGIRIICPVARRGCAGRVSRETSGPSL